MHKYLEIDIVQTHFPFYCQPMAKSVVERKKNIFKK